MVPSSTILPMLLAGEAPAFFGEIAALLVAGALVAFIGHRMGLVPIVGFLLAGVLIGPHALGLVRQPELVDAAAEVGVVLLLFTIGIEFSLEKLGRIRRLIFLGGGLQVSLATAVTAGILAAFGVSWQSGVFTGFLVALSSTAIILKLLADRGETAQPHGQIGLGVLIFQDLAVIVMVLMVPVLGGSAGGAMAILGALAKAVGIIVAVLVLARRLVPPVLEIVARTCSPEIFLLAVVAMCFGTAYLTSLAGVSLSLGAFLAGLLVSESRFSEHAMGEILPLQILFSATFFVSVGMLLDIAFLLRNLPVVLLAIAAVLTVKVVTTGVSVRALGMPASAVAASALMLAQVGEFSFVLERAGREAGLFPAGLPGAGSQTFIAATVVLMVVTPQLTQLGLWLGTRLTMPVTLPTGGSDSTADAVDATDHVLIAGYGQAARSLVHALSNAGIAHVVTTLNPGGAREAEAGGATVLRGDAGKSHMLGLAGLARARVVVVPDDDAATARRIVAVARTGNQDARIVARTRFAADIESLQQVGADQVVAEETESTHALIRDILSSYGAGASVPDEPLVGGAVRAAMGASMTASVAASASSGVSDAAGCAHIAQIRDVQPRTPQGCEECLRIGATWVHLRLCLSCGHVGCCDASPNRHATRHHHETEHPIIRSFEPGESWRWCYVDGRNV